MSDTTPDLVLRGTVTIGDTTVSPEITGVTIKSTVNDVKVPATFTTGITHLPGAQKFTVTFDYLSDDSGDTTLFNILYAAILTDTKELAFTARLRSGVIGVDNPQWNGTFVAASADVGGEVEALSEGSVTCTLTAAPTKTTA